MQCMMCKHATVRHFIPFELLQFSSLPCLILNKLSSSSSQQLQRHINYYSVIQHSELDNKNNNNSNKKAKQNKNKSISVSVKFKCILGSNYIKDSISSFHCERKSNFANCHQNISPFMYLSEK